MGQSMAQGKARFAVFVCTLDEAVFVVYSTAEIGPTIVKQH